MAEEKLHSFEHQQHAKEEAPPLLTPELNRHMLRYLVMAICIRIGVEKAWPNILTAHCLFNKEKVNSIPKRQSEWKVVNSPP